MKGKFNKQNGRGKKNSGGKKGTYRGAKSKFKDNLSKKKKKDKAPKESAKKLFCFNRYRDKKYLNEELKKKQMLEENMKNQYESSESEDEQVDAMQQLLSTFKSSNGNKKSKAVDSSDEEDDMSVNDDGDVEGDLDSTNDVDDELDSTNGDVEGDLDSTNDVDDELDSTNGDVEGDLDSANDVNEDDDESLIDDEEISDNAMESKELEESSEKNTSKIVTYLDENDEEVIQPGQSSPVQIENDDDESKWDDPFRNHLQHDIHESLLESLTAKPPFVETSTLTWSCIGKMMVQIPKSKQNQENAKQKFTILEDKQFASPGSAPKVVQNMNSNALCIKKQIASHLEAANRISLLKRDCEPEEKLTPLQKELFSIMNNYQDLYYPERSFVNGEEIRFTYCLHALNHVIKTRTKILHHNSKLNKKSEVPDEFRDQGLVRPKVLIVVPFKDSAYRIIKMLIALLVPGDPSQVVNKNRFESDFTGGELAMPKKNPKPEDYELTFIGNTEDTFRIGISITKKTLKLYSEFYSSDIIIASPLGLRVIVGAEGEEDRDFDFLASIELLIMDQTEIFLMQNWDHLLHVLDHFHLQPKKTHNTDFSRLRSWAVNGWTKYYRQTLIFSSVSLPEINSVFNKKCFNYAGKVKAVNPVEAGTIRHVTLQIPQVFRRVDVKDPVSAIDTRFDYFIKEILPQYKDTIMAHTIIYVPSYFDYVRIRNYFKKEDVNFVQICEYSKDAKVARARDMFFHSEGHFLLYSERFHFFRRMRIKGIRHIIFYQPPVFPHFYSEMCNLMQEANQNKYGGSESNMTVTTIYTKYDLQQLAAIVSTERTSKMCQSEKAVHMFMTGD